MPLSRDLVLGADPVPVRSPHIKINLKRATPLLQRSNRGKSACTRSYPGSGTPHSIIIIIIIISIDVGGCRRLSDTGSVNFKLHQLTVVNTD